MGPFVVFLGTDKSGSIQLCPSVKKYLKRASKQIAYRLLDSDMDDRLVKFIQLGLLSKASLNELLLSSREKDNVNISSYILEELDKFNKSTFRL